jgi:hypothetical protein
MATIACTSDLHEHLVDVPACDLLLIAGDVSFARRGDLTAKHAFLAGEFKHWLGRASRAKERERDDGDHPRPRRFERA